mmetsp:Transcript_31305/g.38731  ORF Transcript_31305/g.38731 Transcript_31305/m.38731 type:complete len:144 (+) Transcript_31305:164-595(+)|eukprot:CAMPEP_0170454734 /NCGR_PEP_ID=MMETSP0123-20130129/2886_1 /TAXON_ID=182087 /ORGANISM="Favella ehrenbergii, Strain Fehren 1" /LENGTH=143 /DNA_ID=CAMNT_0010717543 /DNA_START=164 /DNA_END=595 /DNA_ORIENTATION=+
MSLLDAPLIMRRQKYYTPDPDYDDITTGAKSYDKCGGAFGEDEETTKWSQIYRYNYILYLIIMCVNILACMCVPCAPALACPGCCFVFSGTPTLTAIILTGYRLKNEKGDLCAQNQIVYATGEEGVEFTFASDAETMRKLWIA